MSPPSLSLLELVACAARHGKGRPWDQKTDPLEQFDRIVVAAELRYNLGPCSEPLLEASLETRLARLNNFRGSPEHIDTLAIDGAGKLSDENPFEGRFDIKSIRVALNRLCEFLRSLNLPSCKPVSNFNNETHGDQVILTAVFILASVCSKLNIGFPTLSGLPPLDSFPLHCIIEQTTTHLWRRDLQQTQRISPPSAFKDATGRSDRIQKQAPPWAPSRPGSASPSQSGSIVQSSPKYTLSPEHSAAAPKLLGEDKANETPMLAPGAVKPPLSSLAHELTARVEQASGAPNSSRVKSGFPQANPGVSDQRVASLVAADPTSPSSIASHDSRQVDTPRSDHTENDWEDINQDKN